MWQVRVVCCLNGNRFKIILHLKNCNVYLHFFCAGFSFMLWIILKLKIQNSILFLKSQNYHNVELGWIFRKYERCVLWYLSELFYHYYFKWPFVFFSGGPLSALTCCVNARLLSAIKKISPLIYSQSWDGSWVYTTQAMMTFTLIF